MHEKQNTKIFPLFSLHRPPYKQQHQQYVDNTHTKICTNE